MKKIIVSVSLLTVLTAGCASVAVTEDAIVQNTATALSLDKSAFTVTNRVDNGIKTTYNVKTVTGKNYSCYVTGTVSYVGRSVSDAICSEVGVVQQPGSTTTTPAPAPKTCDALSKAAGKCK
ncbi:MAG: hypothetical protein K5Q00_07010 [Gammaproteobacteria bacterium]|nr:hypothetical protein [Gammaproteobacteria bacterium]